MKVAIIGAGAAGLAAAYDLAKAGHSVTVYEAAPSTGGLAGGFKARNWDWSVERFYHHWFESDSDVLNLIREIGHGDKIVFPPQKTAVYHKGRFYPLDASLGTLFPALPWLDKLPAAGMVARGILALTYPGLSMLDKIRYGLVGVYLVLTPEWKPLERTAAHEWLRRWQGQHGYEVLWKPLLIGKFGEEHYREVNMAWFWARAHKRSPRLGTFVGGFQAFFDILADKVREQDGIIRLNTPVTQISTTNPQDGSSREQPATLALPVPSQVEGSKAEGSNQQPATSNPQPHLLVRTGVDEEDYNAAIVTTSPRLLAKLAPELPASYTEQLLKLKSMGAVVLILALKHQLSESGIYWHNLPKGEGFPFLAMVEHTNYAGPEHFGGDHIVYCGDYLDPGHEYFRLSKEELLARFLPVLKRFNPRFEPDWVKDSWLFKEPYAQPVPPVNHSQAIPDLRTPIPGLYLASMSQVYPWDRGTNYAVEMGRRMARIVMSEAESNFSARPTNEGARQ